MISTDIMLIYSCKIISLVCFVLFRVFAVLTVCTDKKIIGKKVNVGIKILVFLFPLIALICYFANKKAKKYGAVNDDKLLLTKEKRYLILTAVFAVLMIAFEFLSKRLEVSFLGGEAALRNGVVPLIVDKAFEITQFVK